MSYHAIKMYFKLRKSNAIDEYLDVTGFYGFATLSEV